MKLTESDIGQLRAAQDAQTKLGKLQADVAALKVNPELTQLESEKSATLAALQRESGQLDRLNAEVKRLESDLEVVRKRIQRDEQLLPTMANPKDIAGVEHELVTLRERQDSLETQELEAFEEIDSTKLGLADLEAQLARQKMQIAEHESTRVSRSTELTAEVSAQESLLQSALAALPEELADLLRQLWSRGSGVGELRDTTCGVCHMGLNSSAMNELKRTPKDQLAQCPECRAILLFGGGD